MGRPRSQGRTIDGIEEIATTHGYKVTKRKKDNSQRTLGKKFLPDAIAIPKTGKIHRVFEVENSVTNNTLFKSIMSLATYLKNHDGSFGHLVVPSKHNKFAEQCVKHFESIVRSFGKKAKGKNKRINIDVVTAENIKTDEDKVTKWEDGGRIGQPPKSRYLPR